jgi:predicted DsbA family dithiol-disulfide isomerase
VLFSLKRLQESYPIALHWRSYELRPAGSPPIPPEYKARIDAARPVFAKTMLDEFGVAINAGPFGINSRPSLIVDKFAEAHGQGEAYHMATLEAYWQHGRDISDMAVLRDIAQNTGLDPAALDAAVDHPDYVAQVDADIALARDYGLTGVPAVVLNSRYLVMGAQPYETFESAVKRALADGPADDA